jgi:hypothetical protein
MPLLLFMASVGQQPRYILPVLPPLAILLAAAMTVRARSGARDLRVTTWLVAATFLALAAILVRLRPMLVTVPVAGAVDRRDAADGSGRNDGRRGDFPASCACPRDGRDRGGVPARRAVRGPCGTASRAGRADGRCRADAPHGRRTRRAVPHLHAQSRLLYGRAPGGPDRPHGRGAVPPITGSRPPGHPGDDLPGIEAEAGVTTKELFRVTYLDTAKLRLDALVHPLPERQLQTVGSSPTADAVGCQPMRLDV